MRSSLNTYLSGLLILVACLAVSQRATPSSTCTTTLDPGNYFSQTWDAAGSPYCVTGDIVVGNLTIDPGVEVLVDGPYEISVFTTITAIGTSTAPIRFSAKLPDPPDNQRWRGIKFQDAPSGSTLSHVIIEYSSDAAISVNGASVPDLAHCLIQHNSNASHGGAIAADTVSGNTSITDCIFQDNYAGTGGGSGWGGAIALSNVGGDLLIADSTFRNNSSLSAAGAITAGGFGPPMTGAVTISGSLFQNNSTSAHGAALVLGTNNPGATTISDSAFVANHSTGVFMDGGAMFLSGNAYVHIRNSYLANNRLDASCVGASCTSHAQGGAIYAQSGIILDITDTLISGNSASASGLCPGSPAQGGGVHVNAPSQLLMANTLLVCNEVAASCPNDQLGAGVYIGGAATGLTNVTIARNLPVEGVRVESTTVNMTNSIVFANGGTNGIELSNSGSNVTYSNIQTPGPNPFPGTGNIRTNPGFQGTDCAKNGFVTFSISPAVDTGDPNAAKNDACLPPGQGSSRNDMGAFGGPGDCTPLPEPRFRAMLIAGLSMLFFLARRRVLSA